MNFPDEPRMVNAIFALENLVHHLTPEKRTASA
jgi:hypothetical protein